MLPALFIGHGSPMNALGGNSFSEYLGKLGRDLPRPRGVLCISAHWETSQTEILDVESPRTIHDFSGFPPELYKINYPALGARFLAQETAELLGAPAVRTQEWGLDHGSWGVLIHLFPKADIPVTQLSLSQKLSFAEHLDLAKKLRSLRENGILILGSGNLVHNLRNISWESDAEVMPWARDFDEKIKRALQARDMDMILRFKDVDPTLVRMAIPTAEHYLPLLYVLGASDADEPVSFPFEMIQNGSISMRAVRVG